MPVTLPLEVYEALEKGLGKEDAKRVIHGLETTISGATEYKWAATKDEIITAFMAETGEIRRIIDSLRKEFVTKELFEEKMNALRAEMLGIRTELLGKMEKDKTEVEGKIENVRVDLEGRIENVRVGLGAEIKRLDMKLNFVIVLMIIALTLMNPVMAEIIKGLLNLK
ncbi:MAG: hypothetical protein ACK415_12760 [Thermodesulfovibrionales bacterium]